MSSLPAREGILSFLILWFLQRQHYIILPSEFLVTQHKTRSQGRNSPKLDISQAMASGFKAAC